MIYISLEWSRNQLSSGYIINHIHHSTTSTIPRIAPSSIPTHQPTFLNPTAQPPHQPYYHIALPIQPHPSLTMINHSSSSHHLPKLYNRITAQPPHQPYYLVTLPIQPHHSSTYTGLTYPHPHTHYPYPYLDISQFPLPSQTQAIKLYILIRIRN